MWKIRFHGHNFRSELLRGKKWKPSSKGLPSWNPIEGSRACSEIWFVEALLQEILLIEGRVVCVVSLRPLDCWNWWLEFHRDMKVCRF